MLEAVTAALCGFGEGLGDWRAGGAEKRNVGVSEPGQRIVGLGEEIDSEREGPGSARGRVGRCNVCVTVDGHAVFFHHLVHLSRKKRRRHFGFGFRRNRTSPQPQPFIKRFCPARPC